MFEGEKSGNLLVQLFTNKLLCFSRRDHDWVFFDFVNVLHDLFMKIAPKGKTYPIKKKKKQYLKVFLANEIKASCIID